MSYKITRSIIIAIFGMLTTIIMIYVILSLNNNGNNPVYLSSLFSNGSMSHLSTSTLAAAIKPTLTNTIVAQTSTQTYLPTNTPIPTNTIQPKIFRVYDDFSTGSLNIPFNMSLWKVGTTNNEAVHWEDGYLVFTGKNEGEELRPISPANWRIDDIGRLQADMRIDRTEGSYAFTKIGIDTTLQDGKGTWWVQCRTGSFDSKQAQITCDSYRWKDSGTKIYQTQSYSIQFGKFYSVAIEIKPDGSEVRYFVDGKEIGSYSPEVKDLLKYADFSWSIGIWMDNGASASGAIDNVMIGPQKK